MSDAPSDPERTRYVARPYSELAVGDELWDALTVTETHIVLAASAFNDPGPHHVNALHAERSRFGARIAHGPLLVGIAAGVLGNALGGTIVALLEQSSRFLRPAYLGDTAIVRWEVAERTDKPAFEDGGIVSFEGEVRDQGHRRLAEMEMKLAVGERAPWSPWDPAEPG